MADSNYRNPNIVILMGFAFILSWTVIWTLTTDSDHTAGLLPDLTSMYTGITVYLCGNGF